MVMCFTMKPISSMCPASITLGSSAWPSALQITLPILSWDNSPRGSRCLRTTARTGASYPGMPFISVSSFNKSRVESDIYSDDFLSWGGSNNLYTDSHFCSVYFFTRLSKGAEVLLPFFSYIGILLAIVYKKLSVGVKVALALTKRSNDT